MRLWLRQLASAALSGDRVALQQLRDFLEDQGTVGQEVAHVGEFLDTRDMAEIAGSEPPASSSGAMVKSLLQFYATPKPGDPPV